MLINIPLPVSCLPAVGLTMTLSIPCQSRFLNMSIVQVMGGVGGHHTAAEGRYLMLGNGFLLMNTLAMALYYLR